MLETRIYIGEFIVIKTISEETTCFNKKEAKKIKQNLLEAIDELNYFIENCKD